MHAHLRITPLRVAKHPFNIYHPHSSTKPPHPNFSIISLITKPDPQSRSPGLRNRCCLRYPLPDRAEPLPVSKDTMVALQAKHL